MQNNQIQLNANEKKGFQFLFGILGIYSCYWTAGYLQEKILKQPYVLNNNNELLTFDSPISLIWVQAGVAWLLGFLINKNCNQSSIVLPSMKMVYCAILITVSAFASIMAIKLTSFPVVMMIKSCSIIPVVFVGFFCSKVKDNALKLGPDKIVIALFISIGILIFNLGGDSNANNTATSIVGIILLMISVIADGFLPDLQAVIKSEFNPRPTQMFQHTNKWIALISMLYALLAGEMFYLVEFAQKSPRTVVDLLIFSILGAIGQIFIYRMVKQFKQHIVPFVITTRKIFTVIISIIVYQHSTTNLQIAGIVMVFISTSYQYCSEIFTQKKVANEIIQQVNIIKEFRVDMEEIVTAQLPASQEKLQIS